MCYGIYKITCTVNNRYYVGSTTRSFIERFRSHKRLLKQNRHNNFHLQRDWNRYGLNLFTFEILQVCTDKSSVLKDEQYYLDLCASSDLYNINKLSTSTLGYRHTKPNKDKISAIVKERMNTDSVRSKLNASMISRWKDPIYREQKTLEAKSLWSSSKRKRKTYHGLIDPFGKRYDNITNISEFCAQHNLRLSCVFQLFSGDIKTHKKWRYEYAAI